MSTRLHCEHRIELDAEGFWRVIHAPEYEARVARALGLAEYREVERREEPEAVYRRIEAHPRTLPPALVSALGRFADLGDVHYVEEQWRSRRERAVRWRAIPSVLADRIRVEGVVRVEPAGEHACRRVLEGEVEIRLPVVGGFLERAVVKAAVEAYGKSARLALESDGPGRASGPSPP